MQSTDDLSLLILQGDIDTWIAQLPHSWPYSINLVLRQAPSLMNLFIVGLEVSNLLLLLANAQFTFQRTLLWPASPLPSHITFKPSRERWLLLCQRAEQAIYWMSSPDGAFYLDIWSMTIYPACGCLI